MKQLQAFLYALDDSGAWVTSTFTDLEPFMAAVETAMQVEEPVALVHVGFWQPTLLEVAAIASQHAGSLIVSDLAAAALSEHLVVGAAAIGRVRGVFFRLSIDERFARKAGGCEPAAGIEVAEAKAWSPAAQVTSGVASAPRGDWLASLANSDPD